MKKWRNPRRLDPFTDITKLRDVSRYNFYSAKRYLFHLIDVA